MPPIFSNPKLPLLYGEIVSSGVYFKKISTPRKNFSSWDAVDINVESAEDVLESLENKDKGEILMNSEVILCPGSFMNVSSKIRTSHESFCEDVIQDGFDLASTISPSESRHDSIVELYCDDEFRMGLELDNSHLGLSSCEDLTSMIGSVEDIIDDDRDEIFLPYSVPSVMLRESFKETFEWENVDSTDSMACIS